MLWSYRSQFPKQSMVVFCFFVLPMFFCGCVVVVAFVFFVFFFVLPMVFHCVPGLPWRQDCDKTKESPVTQWKTICKTKKQKKTKQLRSRTQKLPSAAFQTSLARGVHNYRLRILHPHPPPPPLQKKIQTEDHKN